MARTTFHVCIHIADALARSNKWLDKMLAADGRDLSGAEVREYLIKEREKGFTHFSGCDNRDVTGSCSGHPVAEPDPELSAADFKEANGTLLRVNLCLKDELSSTRTKLVSATYNRDNLLKCIEAVLALPNLNSGHGFKTPTPDQRRAECAAYQSLHAAIALAKSGQYYTEDGTLMNADGTRSIFDDVDE